MVLNLNKFNHIFKYLLRTGWSFYKRQDSTLLCWIDPQHPTNDYRTKDAYTKQKEREPTHA